MEITVLVDAELHVILCSSVVDPDPKWIRSGSFSD